MTATAVSPRPPLTLGSPFRSRSPVGLGTLVGRREPLRRRAPIGSDSSLRPDAPLSHTKPVLTGRIVWTGFVDRIRQVALLEVCPAHE